MALSHILNSKAGVEHHEPVVGSLFRVTIIPPPSVANSEILTESIISLTGWTNPGPESIQQQFQTARINFASSDVDLTQNITAEFKLNLNKANEMYVYKIIRAWKNSVYNSATGEEGKKEDYIGKIIAENYARNGDIFWTRVLHNVWPSGNLEGLDLDYTSSDPQNLSVNFVADYYTEVLV